MAHFVSSFLAFPLLYLDPGSGSLLIQLIIAGLIGIGVTVRLFWSRITGLFGGNKSGVAESSDDEDEA